MIHRFYIGIDCGVSTGYARWDKEEKALTHMGTIKIHMAMEYVKDLVQSFPCQVFVRVEDARKRKWIPYQRTEKSERGRREGAGSVKRDAVIWEDFLTWLGVDFEMVAPKDNRTKLTSIAFRKITGWVPLTSKHSRDAAMLVFGL